MDDILRPCYLDELDCKAEKCRFNCCTGWKINLTPDEISCLRHTSACSDMAKRIAGCTDEAGFIMTDERRCPLLSDSNLCMLRLEGMADATPSVCRAFPVTERALPVKSCAASTACERVTELLISSGSFALTGSAACPGERVPRAVFAAQNAALSLMDDQLRSVSSSAAVNIRFACKLSECGSSLSAAVVRCILSDIEPIQTEVCHSDPLSALLGPLSVLSGSVGNMAHDIIGIMHSDVKAEHGSASEQSKRYRPLTDNAIRGITANHIFYTGFPYSDRFADCESEAAALAAFYVLIRLSHVLPRDQIDSITVISRAFEHGNADMLCAEALLPSLMRDPDTFIAAVRSI